jgi:hypothetical protein
MEEVAKALGPERCHVDEGIGARVCQGSSLRSLLAHGSQAHGRQRRFTIVKQLRVPCSGRVVCTEDHRVRRDLSDLDF